MPSAPTTADVAAYRFRQAIYVNLTNECPTACVFCIKRSWKWGFHGADLKLGAVEPTIEETWRQIEVIRRERPFKELVFCGYGESTLRLPAMAGLGLRLRRAYPGVETRLNTVGLGSLVWGYDLAPELKRFLDAVCVSLNTADPAQWLELHRPKKEYRQEGFKSVLAFIRACVKAGLRTVVTAVEQPGVDLEAVKALAEKLGAEFRLRPALEPLS